MADVFISYSREDKAFVRHLFDALKADDRDTWVDWEDIPPTADWLAEIYAAIEAADTFVFVISPDSVASEVCNKEVAHAVKHNKRLVPIIRQEIDETATFEALAGCDWEAQAQDNWQALKRLNWLFFRESDDFDSAFQSLLEAIEADLDWVRAHTRFLVRAREWYEKGRDKSFVLRGEDLQEAEQWLAQGATKDPRPTALQTQYILTSRQDATRRQRTTLGVVIAVCIIVGVAAAVAFYLYRVAESERQVAQTEAEARATQQAIAEAEAEARATQQAIAEERARVALSRQLAAQARTHFSDWPDLAMLLCVEANYLADTLEAKGSLLDGFSSNPHLSTFLRGHTDWVYSVTFNPDGQTLASGSCAKFDDDQCVEGEIHLWDVTARQQLGEPIRGHTDRVNSVAFSPDGNTLASASLDNTIILWDVATGQPLGEPFIGHKDEVWSVAFSPNGKTLASGGNDGYVILWEVETGEPVGGPLAYHSKYVTSVAFSPDGKTLASGGCAKYDRVYDCSKGEIVFWDVAERKPLGPRLTGHGRQVISLAFSPDGKTLASGSCSGEGPGPLIGGLCTKGEVLLWDVAARQQLGEPLSGHTDVVLSVAFSLYNNILASGSRDGSIILWDIEEGKTIGEPLSVHAEAVLSLAFSPDGKTLASGSCARVEAGQKCTQGDILLWNAAAPHPLVQYIIESDRSINHVAFSPQTGILISSDSSVNVSLWEAATGEPVGQPLRHEVAWDGISHLWIDKGGYRAVFSPNGETLAAVSTDSTILLWDMTTSPPTKSQQLAGHTDFVNSVAFSPDGNTLASGGWDDTIILWDLATGQPIWGPLTGHSDVVYTLAISPDGKTLASGSRDGTIILWDIATGEPISQPISAHTDGVISLAFSSTDRIMASGSEDGTVILWDTEIWQPIAPPLLTGHVEYTMGGLWGVSVAFSPDGQTLVSGSCGRFNLGSCVQDEVRLWDVATGQIIAQPLTIGAIKRVNSVAFSPNGQSLAAALSGYGGAIVVWDLEHNTWIEHACNIANRNLTLEEWEQYLGGEPYRKTCPDLP